MGNSAAKVNEGEDLLCHLSVAPVPPVAPISPGGEEIRSAAVSDLANGSV